MRGNREDHGPRQASVFLPIEELATIFRCLGQTLEDLSTQLDYEKGQLIRRSRLIKIVVLLLWPPPVGQMLASVPALRMIF